MNQSKVGKKGYEKTKDAIKAHREGKSRTTRERYEASPYICPNCDEVIPFEKRWHKFCSQSCAASYNNRGVVRVKKTRSDICAYCGEPKETRQNKYCNACITNGVYNKAQSLSEIKTDRHRKHFLIRMRGHQCEYCKLTKWMGKPIPIELHHVDGNADNNTEENLKLICPNCHAQTETYKGANAGGDSSARQKKRRKRYREGKTY